MDKDFEIFLDILLRATERIEAHYFQLPIAGSEEPIYRERVYCYELYHRIRECTPNDYAYVLDGEVDKAGHPILRQETGRLKPDFIVHVPGTMDRNLAIVEVKPINADNGSIQKDAQTLRLFLERAQYFKAVYLVYGVGTPKEFGNFPHIVREVFRDIQRERIVLVWHQGPLQRAALQ